MARRPWKTYSNPAGYKASLSAGSDVDRRRRILQHNLAWGMSPVRPGYKPGAGAPRFLSTEPTETKEDMDERRGALDSVAGELTGDSNRIAEVLAATGSHGTVEASQRGMYSGRTVQAPSSSGEIAKGFEHLYGKEGGEGLTDRQKAGIDQSVRAEVDSRMTAKVNGVAYTGAHSSEEQQAQADAYKGQVEKFRADYVANNPDKASDAAANSGGPEMRTFRPGISYAAPAPRSGPEKAENGSQRSDEDVLNDKSSSDADFIAAAERQANAIFNKPEEGTPQQSDATGQEGRDEEEEEYSFGVTADAKGGRTSLPRPAARAPVSSLDALAPSEPSLVFGSRAEAAAALMSRGAEMDYPTFAQAAAVASLPGPGDGPDYDPEDSFANLVTGRISDELLSLAERVEAYDARREDAYHSSNADAVAMAAGVSPEVYAAATPDERLYLQEKFMDSF